MIVLRCLQAVYGFSDGESDGEEGRPSQSAVRRGSISSGAARRPSSMRGLKHYNPLFEVRMSPYLLCFLCCADGVDGPAVIVRVDTDYRIDVSYRAGEFVCTSASPDTSTPLLQLLSQNAPVVPKFATGDVVTFEVALLLGRCYFACVFFQCCVNEMRRLM